MEQMNANQRIIFRLGQSIVEAESMADQLRELQAKNKELEAKIAKHDEQDKSKSKAK